MTEIKSIKKENIQRHKLNLIDFLFLLTIIFSVTGFIIAKAEKSPLNKIIEGKEKIAIEVLIPDVFSSTSDYFKVDEKSAITIRNRPYTKLSIIKAESKPKLAIIPNGPGAYKTLTDPTKANVKDYIVTLSDVALKTEDGYVTGGNKIKIGNQVELEGFNYRLTGKVINVYSLNDQ